MNADKMDVRLPRKVLFDGAAIQAEAEALRAEIERLRKELDDVALTLDAANGELAHQATTDLGQQIENTLEDRQPIAVAQGQIDRLLKSVVEQTLEIEWLRKEMRLAIDDLACSCTCGEAYTSRGLTAPDCLGCWVAPGIRRLRAALGDEEAKIAISQANAIAGRELAALRQVLAEHRQKGADHEDHRD